MFHACFNLHAVHQNLYRRETFGPPTRRPYNQSDASAAFRSQLQTARLTGVELRQWGDHHGYARAVQRLIHSPKRILLIGRADHDQSMKPHPKRASGWRIKITPGVDHHDSMALLLCGTGILLVEKLHVRQNQVVGFERRYSVVSRKIVLPSSPLTEGGLRGVL